MFWPWYGSFAILGFVGYIRSGLDVKLEGVTVQSPDAYALAHAYLTTIWGLLHYF